MWTRSPVMLGRDGELDELDALLKGVRTGQGRAAFVVGEPGIGKSRLAREVAGRGRADGMGVLRGRGSTIGPMVPFRPLSEALLSWFRASDRPDHAELRPYRAALGRLVPDWQDTRSAGDRSLIMIAEAVLRALSLVGRDGGCLVVLEDLHEYDAETLAVVEYLVDNISDHPVMLLGTARTEYGPALDIVRSATQRDCADHLELRRLTRTEVRQMVAECLATPPAEVPPPVEDYLWHCSVGVPLLVEELVHGLVGGGLLVADGPGWRVTGDLDVQLPATLTRSVTVRADRLGPNGRAVLGAAAVLGGRFPLAVVQRATGLDDRTVRAVLHQATAEQLVTADATPAWYAFRHPLTVDALLSELTPDERAELSRRAADVVRQLYPDLPGEWCQLAGVLLQAAGDTTAAAARFAEAGRRALADGAAGSAVVLLERAERLFAGSAEAAGHADTLESLLYALAEAGQLDRAQQLVERLGATRHAVLDPERTAALHVRFAWVAAAGGRFDHASAEIAAARAALGPCPAPRHSAPVDAAAAVMVMESPGPDRLTRAEALARLALDAAERADLPAVSCQALQTVGTLVLGHDHEEARRCFERSRTIADERRLPIWRMYAVARLATLQWVLDGSAAGVRAARDEAMRGGAVFIACNLDAVLSLHTVLSGDFAAARAHVERCSSDASRLRLGDLANYLCMVRAVLAAHQARRTEMEKALAEYADSGAMSQTQSLTFGLARAFCALLEDDQPLAREELRRAAELGLASPSTMHLAGEAGLRLLLDVLAGDAGPAEHAAIAGTTRAGMRWNLQFVLLAEAVLLGRRRRPVEAAERFGRAQSVARPYVLARRLGARLVAPAAAEDGWGDPVRWLRRSEEYFHRARLPTAATGCRTVLRGMGVPVLQRRLGTERVPAVLRALGVTLREYEVMDLLGEGLDNKTIAARLHISARTVEKHVAGLLAKTGHRGRRDLGRYVVRLRQEP